MDVILWLFAFVINVAIPHALFFTPKSPPFQFTIHQHRFPTNIVDKHQTILFLPLNIASSNDILEGILGTLRYWQTRQAVCSFLGPLLRPPLLHLPCCPFSQQQLVIICDSSGDRQRDNLPIYFRIFFFFFQYLRYYYEYVCSAYCMTFIANIFQELLFDKPSSLESVSFRKHYTCYDRVPGKTSSPSLCCPPPTQLIGRRTDRQIVNNKKVLWEDLCTAG